MATTEKLTTATQVTLFSSGSSLANNATSVGSAVNNTQGQTSSGDGFPFGRLTFSGTFAAAPSANTAIYIWFITSEDGGTTYEDSSVTPVRAPDAIIPLDATNTTQQKTAVCDVPVGSYKPMVQNTSGQTLNSTWTLKLLPWTPQGV